MTICDDFSKFRSALLLHFWLIRQIIKNGQKFTKRKIKKYLNSFNKINATSLSKKPRNLFLKTYIYYVVHIYLPFRTVLNSSERFWRLCIKWLALNFELVCLFKNFLWSLFSWQSHRSKDFISRCRQADIFQRPFFFTEHLNFWNIWQGDWNLGFKHSTASIPCLVNFFMYGLVVWLFPEKKEK